MRASRDAIPDLRAAHDQLVGPTARCSGPAHVRVRPFVVARVTGRAGADRTCRLARPALGTRIGVGLRRGAGEVAQRALHGALVRGGGAALGGAALAGQQVSTPGRRPRLPAPGDAGVGRGLLGREAWTWLPFGGDSRSIDGTLRSSSGCENRVIGSAGGPTRRTGASAVVRSIAPGTARGALMPPNVTPRSTARARTPWRRRSLAGGPRLWRAAPSADGSSAGDGGAMRGSWRRRRAGLVSASVMSLLTGRAFLGRTGPAMIDVWGGAVKVFLEILGGD